MTKNSNQGGGPALRSYLFVYLFTFMVVVMNHHIKMVCVTADSASWLFRPVGPHQCSAGSVASWAQGFMPSRDALHLWDKCESTMSGLKMCYAIPKLIWDLDTDESDDQSYQSPKKRSIGRAGQRERRIKGMQGLNSTNRYLVFTHSTVYRMQPTEMFSKFFFLLWGHTICDSHADVRFGSWMSWLLPSLLPPLLRSPRPAKVGSASYQIRSVKNRPSLIVCALSSQRRADLGVSSCSLLNHAHVAIVSLFFFFVFICFAIFVSHRSHPETTRSVSKHTHNTPSLFEFFNCQT